jgi:PII-like signaling protein
MQLRRRVPVVTVVIDSPDRIGAAFEIVDRITRHIGLVTSELVPGAVQVERGSGPGQVRLASPGVDAS